MSRSSKTLIGEILWFTAICEINHHFWHWSTAHTAIWYIVGIVLAEVFLNWKAAKQ